MNVSGCKCDLCLDNITVIREDGKNEALEVLSCLQNMQQIQGKVTLQLLILVYQGSKRKEVMAKSLNSIPEFGKGKAVFSAYSLKHFIQMLISENAIIERLRGSNETGTIPYLTCGDKEELIKRGELVIWKYKI